MSTKTNHYSMTIFFMCLTCLIAWVGCTVGFDTAAEGAFYCESDEDCLTPAFICDRQDPANPVCIRKSTASNEGPPCQDSDGDGYGAAGTDRSNCQFPEPDCDDNDPTINPGAQEICDGKDNNCDGSTDVIPCQTASQCPRNQRDPEGNAVIYQCDEQSGTCLARPVNQICEPICPECREVLACQNGSLSVVPSACR